MVAGAVQSTLLSPRQDVLPCTTGPMISPRLCRQGHAAGAQEVIGPLEHLRAPVGAATASLLETT